MVASIFYSRSSWHCLLIKVIKPFIVFEMERNAIGNWSVYFSNVRGEHINLSIEPSNAEQLHERFFELAQKFLIENPSLKNEVSYPIKSFFMDYPNNSVQLNNKRLLAPLENSGRNLQQEISEAIVEGLGHEVFETASVYTFLIYMQLGVIKAAYPSIRQAKNKLPELLHYLNEHDNIKKDKSDAHSGEALILKQMFENNRKILPEIIQDVWNDRTKITPKWLNDWMKACKNFSASSNFNYNFSTRSTQLCRHLGLDNKTVNFLSSRLIIRSFNMVQ